MKLGNINEVNQLSQERRKLTETLVSIGSCVTGYVGVTFQGRYQDDDIIEAIRPTLIEILKTRIAKVSAKLEALGVTIQ